MKKPIIFFVTFLIFLLAAGQDPAYSFDLAAPNTPVAAYPGPYVNVEITLTNPTTATVTVTSYTQGLYTYMLGSTDMFGLNVNGPVSVSNVSGSNFAGGTYFTGGAPADRTPPPNPPYNISEFGEYNIQITNTDGFKDALTNLSFVLTKTSGTWANVQDVTKINSKGCLAAAHVWIYTPPVSGNPGAVGTGFVSARW